MFLSGRNGIILFSLIRAWWKTLDTYVNGSFDRRRDMSGECNELMVDYSSDLYIGAVRITEMGVFSGYY